ncbi:MAG: hypothetical protein V7K50_18115 [Nostoc sp.]|uniref:hypothetical protein n=1 Tax=Nostoc sp. TaxID=1180 RepID=UPI002FF54ADF
MFFRSQDFIPRKKNEPQRTQRTQRKKERKKERKKLKGFGAASQRNVISPGFGDFSPHYKLLMMVDLADIELIVNNFEMQRGVKV